MNTLSTWKFRATLFAVILAVAPSAAVSHAQDMDNAVVVVKVPFAFVDGSQHFPAGLYNIRMDDQKILAIHGQSDSGFVMAWFSEDSHPSNSTKVVFRRYGDQYFLQEIWISGESRHTYCLPSKSEKREMAANNAVPTNVVVAALGMPR
jgi:hypothetical protein